MSPVDGCLRGGWRLCLNVAVVVLFLAVPSATVPGAAAVAVADETPGMTDPPRVPSRYGVAPTAGVPDLAGWTATASVEELEETLVAWDQDTARSPIPRPDLIDAYTTLPEDAQRVAWQAWLLRTQVAADRHEAPGSLFDHDARPGTGGAGADRERVRAPYTVHAPAGVEADADQEEEDASGRPAEIAARGMRGVWTLEAHGQARSMLPADDEGATFLITDQAAMRFDAPGSPASWMVKPGYLRHVATTDATGDGVQDLVLGTWSFFGDEEDPTVVVVDGVSGAILFAGLAGDDAIYSWVLSDVDGDGVEDLMGIDVQGRKVAYTLTGDPILQVAPDESTRDSTCAPVACVATYYMADIDHGYADVDGDGVQDYLKLDWVWAVASVVFFRPGVDTVLLVAYSGTDGSELWRVPLRGLNGNGWLTIGGGADATGDGLEDVLVRRVQVMHTGFTVSVSFTDASFAIHDGADGALLLEDGQTSATVAPPGVPHSLRTAPYEGQTIADLDGDGADEFIMVDASDLKAARRDDSRSTGTVTFAAVRPGATPASEPETVYAFDVDLPATTDTEMLSMVRDVDGDGAEEMVFLTFTIGSDDDGNFTEVSSHLYVAAPDGTSDKAFEAPLLYWDVHPATGQTYGWTLDDRWAPVDAAGHRVGDGMRMVVSSYPMAEHDVDRDGTADFLLRQSSGIVWVDGRSGRLLDAYERPPTRWVRAVTEEPDGLHVLERDRMSDTWSLTRLEDGTPRWSYDTDAFDGYITRFADVTADGRSDLVLLDHGAGKYTVFDPEEDAQVWEVEREGADDGRRSVRVVDALPDRIGEELVVTERSHERQERSYALHRVDEEEPLWTHETAYQTGLGPVSEGRLVLTSFGEGAVLEVLDSRTGVVDRSIALPSDSSVTGIALVDILPGGGPELAVAYYVEEGEDDLAQYGMYHDLVRDEEIVHFNLSAPRVERFVHEYATSIGETDGFVYERLLPTVWLGPMVGDWDGDGRRDMSFREHGYPVVRSSLDGGVIAAAPSEGAIMSAVDLNGDDLPEVAVRSDSGQLRVFRADSSVEAGGEAEDGPVRTIEEPAEATVEDETFFDDTERAVPAPAAGLAVLGLLGGLFALRRRRA